MKSKFLIFLALLGSLPCTAPAEVVIKILHLAKWPKVQAIWTEAAQEYEKTHHGVKVEFSYLENEAFKAKLPTLFQSKDRPSVFHSWHRGFCGTRPRPEFLQVIRTKAWNWKQSPKR